MIGHGLRLVLALVVAALAWQVARTGELEGRLLGVPYDLRPPTPARLKERLWNPRDQRLFTPSVFGWGFAVNLHQFGRRLGLIVGD